MFASSGALRDRSRRCVANVTLLAEVSLQGHTLTIFRGFQLIQNGTGLARVNRGGHVKRGLIIVTLAILAATCGRVNVPDTDQPSEAQLTLRAMLGRTARPPFVTADSEGARLWKLTRAFYERRKHEFAWIDEKHPTGHMDALIRALKAADREGLDPEMYSLS